MRKRLGACAALAGAIALAGCGGSGTLSKSDYEKKLKADTQELRTAFGKIQGNPSSLDALAKQVDVAQATTKKIADDLDGATLYSTDAAEGPVALVVYPWEIALAREAPLDSSLNHVSGPIASVVPVGNRLRVRVGPLVAEVTAASAERLGLRPGERVVASFKATQARLLSGG